LLEGAEDEVGAGEAHHAGDDAVLAEERGGVQPSSVSEP